MTIINLFVTKRANASILLLSLFYPKRCLEAQVLPIFFFERGHQLIIKIIVKMA